MQKHLRSSNIIYRNETFFRWIKSFRQEVPVWKSALLSRKLVCVIRTNKFNNYLVLPLLSSISDYYQKFPRSDYSFPTNYAHTIWDLVCERSNRHHFYQKSDDAKEKLIPIILNPDLTDPEEMSLRKELATQLKEVPAAQRAVYENELKKIDRILSNYRLVRSSVSYDVFISVKQQRHGNPTRDSFTAVTLYNFLTAKGLKVFNSRLTPPPAGQEYEPYIISALMSAKAMIVVGTTRENMEAQWVKLLWYYIYCVIV